MRPVIEALFGQCVQYPVECPGFRLVALEEKLAFSRGSLLL